MRVRLHLLGLVLVSVVATSGWKCDCTPTCNDSTVDPADPYFARFEGIGAENACMYDADCVIGGCSGEVCAAETVYTTCELLPYSPEGACGCIGGECWWHVAEACTECVTDADCELFSNYCDGCSCEALTAGSPPPPCSGTQVLCFVDPCWMQTAACNAGECVVSPLVR